MRNIPRARALAIAFVGALLAIATPGRAQAQNAVITGKVTSEFGQVIEGANVFISDLAISVATNAEGNFTLTVPAARVSGQQTNIRVRAVGYQPQVRPVRVTAGSQTFNFTMKQDVNRLDEIVVTGTVEGVERSKVAFAVGRLTTEDMPIPALDPLRQLAGKIPGMRIAQTTGQPGTNPEIMMRGPTSINGTGRDRSPLIIVDNAIMNVGSLNELGALDIESIEVVKGAAGASLYGTRAANGVITIKTKRGVTGGSDGVKFNVRSEYGISDLNSISYGLPLNHQLQLDESGKRFCVATFGSNVAPCSRTVDWMKEIYRINNVYADTTRNPQTIQWNAPAIAGGELQNIYQASIWPNKYYNMLGQVLQRNPVMLNSVDASGRISSVRFYVSGSYQNEQGAVRGLEGTQQRRGRVNLDYDARHDLLISASTLYDNGTTDLRSGGSFSGGIFGQLLRGAAAGTDYLARDTLGRYLVRSGGASLRSPTGNGGGTFLYDTENLNSARTSNRFLGNLTGTYFPKEWVTFEGTFAYDMRHRVDKFWEVKGYRSVGISTADNNGRMSTQNFDNEAFNGSLTTTLRKQLTPDLNGKLQFRGLFDQENQFLNTATGQVFLVKDLYTGDNTSANKNLTSSSQTIKNIGYFAGTSLDYKDRYILDATFRVDGSSLFGAGNRWAPFGRLSGVWRVSQEDFWNVNWMSDFRLRASRGTAGSTPRFNAQYETYTVATTGVSLGQAGNSQLKPETTTETELGTDFTLFNRLGIEFTNARSTTKDQILLVNTPAALGFSQQWQNAGTLKNNTYEVGLNLPVMTSRDLQWSMRGTWDRTRTTVSELFAPEYVTDAGTGQGTGTFFRVTANTSCAVPGISTDGKMLTAGGTPLDCSNGFQVNRFGNIYGRKFYTSCDQLPNRTVVNQVTGVVLGAYNLQARCGEGKEYQVNDEGYVVWVGGADAAGNTKYTWRQGITDNLWQTRLTTAQSPWNMPVYWGMPIVDRPLKGEQGEGVGVTQIIGNVFPDFRFSYSNNVTWKKLNFYGLIDGTIGHEIYNQGEGWGLLDVSSAHFDQQGKAVENAKPMGYSWRAGAPESTGIGGFYDVLGPNNYVVEDGSFAKIREASVTYRVGPVRSIGDWTVGLIGRNLYTFTKYSGLDPEVGATGGSGTNGTGSGLINQVDAFGFPTLRTFTVSLSTRF